MPNIPVRGTCSRVGKLTSMGIYCSCTINLTHTPLHISEPKTHLPRVPIRQDLNRLLVNCPRRRDPESTRRFPDVEFKHLEPVVIAHGTCRTLVDAQGMSCQPVLLFQFAVKKVQRFREFRWTVHQGLFK